MLRRAWTASGRTCSGRRAPGEVAEPLRQRPHRQPNRGDERRAQPARARAFTQRERSEMQAPSDGRRVSCVCGDRSHVHTYAVRQIDEMPRSWRSGRIEGCAPRRFYARFWPRSSMKWHMVIVPRNMSRMEHSQGFSRRHGGLLKYCGGFVTWRCGCPSGPTARGTKNVGTPTHAHGHNHPKKRNHGVSRNGRRRSGWAHGGEKPTVALQQDPPLRPPSVLLHEEVQVDLRLLGLPDCRGAYCGEWCPPGDLVGVIRHANNTPRSPEPPRSSS